jgi:hypothetical protein
MTADDGGWGIGGYVPIGYKVTPWSTLFPALATYPSATSPKSINLSKLYVFYLTRIHFAQYLAFLKDVGVDWHKNEALDEDLQLLHERCGDLYSQILLASSGQTLSDDTFKKIISDFKQQLLGGVGSKKFYSEPIYKIFGENYNFFMKCPYGFVAVYEGGSNYPGRFYLSDDVFEQSDFRASPVKGQFTLIRLLRNAIRIYPVFSQTGTLSFVTYFRDVWQSVPIILDSSRFQDNYITKRHAGFVDKDGFKNYVTSSTPSTSSWLYPVDFDCVAADTIEPIRGAPMLYRLPFEFFQSYGAGKVASIGSPT